MADDPLAPIQAGDDVRKILSASRQNALADAARTVNGNLPVRWARRRKPRTYRPPTLLHLSNVYAIEAAGTKYEAQFGYPPRTTTQHTTYLDLPGTFNSWYTFFWDAPPGGFPATEDHPLYEIQDDPKWNKRLLTFKKGGLYRLSWFYNVYGAVEGWSSPQTTTGTASGHAHTYERFDPMPISPYERTLALALCIYWAGGSGRAKYQEANLDWWGWPGARTGTIEVVMAMANDAGPTARWVMLEGYAAGDTYHDDDRFLVTDMRVTVERIGEYVAD